MFSLKEYQTRTLETLKLYFQECQRIGKASTAFYEVTNRSTGPESPIGMQKNFRACRMSAYVSPREGARPLLPAMLLHLQQMTCYMLTVRLCSGWSPQMQSRNRPLMH